MCIRDRDIGGTDVKLAASVDGTLCVFKEYDWFPAGFARAEQIIDPLLLLTRLMRAGASCHRVLGQIPGEYLPAFGKEASDAAVLAACEGMESLLGEQMCIRDRYPNTRFGRGPIGGIRYAGTSSISANVGQGRGTLATPDGRHAGEPLAEGCSPSHAMDKSLSLIHI